MKDPPCSPEILLHPCTGGLRFHKGLWCFDFCSSANRMQWQGFCATAITTKSHFFLYLRHQSSQSRRDLAYFILSWAISRIMELEKTWCGFWGHSYHKFLNWRFSDSVDTTICPIPPLVLKAFWKGFGSSITSDAEEVLYAGLEAVVLAVLLPFLAFFHSSNLRWSRRHSNTVRFSRFVLSSSFTSWRCSIRVIPLAVKFPNLPSKDNSDRNAWNSHFSLFSWASIVCHVLNVAHVLTSICFGPGL